MIHRLKHFILTIFHVCSFEIGDLQMCSFIFLKKYVFFGGLSMKVVLTSTPKYINQGTNILLIPHLTSTQSSTNIHTLTHMNTPNERTDVIKLFH